MLRLHDAFLFFPKQFTVGVLNATLDLAALVLVGVVGFLGSEVVLSPVVSGCLPSCGGWVLVGAAAILGSEVVLSPVVSGCLPSCGGWVLVGVVGFLSPVVSCCPPFMWGVGVGWCGRLLGLWSGLVSRCLRLSPFMWGLGVGCCGRLLGLWSGPLSLVVSGCLPSCGGRVLVGVAASRTETFRDQNHRLQSKYAYCKLFGVYAGVILEKIPIQSRNNEWRGVLGQLRINMFCKSTIKVTDVCVGSTT